MRIGGWSIVLAVALLAGCSNDPPEVAEQGEGQAVAAGTREVRCFTAGDLEGVPAPTYEHSILAFGDSLFAGYGVCPDQGYPEQLQFALQKGGIDAQVIDAGVSGDTTAAARQRVAFVLDGLDTPPDLALVEFGGNDLLRGIPPAQTRENLSAILAEFEERDIPVLLMGMRAPPNLGEAYVAEFDAIYPALAERHGARLVPFFLEAVYDQPALIQPDRIHPTAEGIEALVGATKDAVAGALPAAD